MNDDNLTEKQRYIWAFISVAKMNKMDEETLANLNNGLQKLSEEELSALLEFDRLGNELAHQEGRDEFEQEITKR